MGLYKRFISNDLVRKYYNEGGILKLKTLLTTDVFIYESGIASDFISLVNSNLSEQDLWIAVKEVIQNDIYIKGYMLPAGISNAKIYEIMHNSEYSRDEKLMQLKSYLSKFINELDAYGIDYTYMASKILIEYYERSNGIKNNG